MYSNASSNTPSITPVQKAATMMRSLLSVGSSMYQALPGSPRTNSSGTKTLSRWTMQDPIERIPSLDNGVTLMPGDLAGTQKSDHALVALLDILVGASEQQQVVGHMRGRAPDLLAAHDPTAVDSLRLRAQRTQHIGTSTRLSERNGRSNFPAAICGRNFAFCASEP